MTLKNPSNFFREEIEEKEILVEQTDRVLREELTKVENLSDELSRLQQQIHLKVVENDVASSFKKQVSELTDVVNNLVQNEIPRYKKQVAGNEIRLSNQVSSFKEDIDKKVEGFYKKIGEFKDVIQVIETVSLIEKYINTHHQDLMSLKEEVLDEIEQIPVGNIQENLERLERKIDFIRDTYSQIDPELVAKEIIQEGLLDEPLNSKNQDPLTPLDQKFVTINQLQDHYRLFLGRIQQQLSTLGGGGETKLQYLDDIVGIATNASVYDGKFLKYNHTLGKFEFVTVSGTGGSSDYASVAGIATYASVAGIATNAQGLTGTPSITVASVTASNLNSSGIVTASSFRPSGGFIQAADGTNSLYIYSGTGNVAFQGTIGASQVNNASGYKAFDFGTTTTPSVNITNELIVGAGASIVGVVTASSFSGNATSSTTAGYATTAGISTYATTAGVSTIAGYASTAGISTISQGLTGTPNITVGVITATDYRIQSVSEKTTLVNGNTVSLVYNTGSGNIAICTNPSGDVTLNVTGIPTDSNFDNRSLTFSVIVNNTGTARSCTAVNLNGLSRTIKWFGGSLSAAISGVTTSSGYDIYNFTGINTVGSASTTSNYEVLGTVNGGYR